MAITITAPAKPATYAEIGQSLVIKFAWAVQTAPKEFQLQHSYVNCRDFLPDFLWCLANKAAGKKSFDKGIYGYYTQDHHVKSPYMVLELKHGTVKDLKANMATFVPTSAIEFIGSTGNQAVVKWSEEAMNSPWRISFFTFFLKLCCLPAAGDLKTLIEQGCEYGNEAQYTLAVGPKGIEGILKNWDKLNDPEQTIGNPTLQNFSIGAVHNNTGWVAMFKKSSNSELAQQLKGLIS